MEIKYHQRGKRAFRQVDSLCGYSYKTLIKNSMNKKLPKLVLKIIFGLALTGCAVSNAKFFAEIKKANDPSFGHTPENPVMIKNSDLNNSIGSSYYYL